MYFTFNIKFKFNFNKLVAELLIIKQHMLNFYSSDQFPQTRLDH